MKQLKNLRKNLKPNGLIAITLQPRTKGATDETAKQEGEKIVSYLRETGFTNIRLETKNISPILAICVIGVNPE